MTYLSEMQNRKPNRSPIYKFRSKEAALEHLKAYSIEPSNNQFTLIAERHFGEKTFDALDCLMIDHGYKVQWV